MAVGQPCKGSGREASEKMEEHAGEPSGVTPLHSLHGLPLASVGIDPIWGYEHTEEMRYALGARHTNPSLVAPIATITEEEFLQGNCAMGCGCRCSSWPIWPNPQLSRSIYCTRPDLITPTLAIQRAPTSHCTQKATLGIVRVARRVRRVARTQGMPSEFWILLT